MSVNGHGGGRGGGGGCGAKGSRSKRSHVKVHEVQQRQQATFFVNGGGGHEDHCRAPPFLASAKRILDHSEQKGESSSSSSSWYWDYKQINASYFGSLASGRCKYCFQEISGQQPVRVNQSCCLSVEQFCNDYCKKAHQVKTDLTCEHQDVIIELSPSCLRRDICTQCCRAKDKHSPDRPCRVSAFATANASTSPPAQMQHQQYFYAIADLFELFLTFLFKHENDSLKNTDQCLSVLFDNPDRPPGEIIHLFVTILHYLSLAKDDETTVMHSAVSEKLLAFYNLMTLYHRQFNIFARFGTQHFLWWDVYITNWTRFSQWLLGMVLLTKLTEDCACPMKNFIEIPPVLSQLALPRRLEVRNAVTTTTATPVVSNGGNMKKKSFSLVFDSESVGDGDVDVGFSRTHCSVCRLELQQQQPAAGLWIEEFLRSDKEPQSFPCQRIWPRMYTRWDLLLIIVSLGRLPVGMVCSEACLNRLNEEAWKSQQEQLSLPRRLRRLLKCSTNKCNQITVKAATAAVGDYVGDDLTGFQTCRSNCMPSSVPTKGSRESKAADDLLSDLAESLELPATASLAVKKEFPEGAFRKCDYCSVETVMLQNCPSCQSRFYCSDTCRLQDSGTRHGCETLRRSLWQNSLVLLDIWVCGRWTLLAKDFDIWQVLEMCLGCRSCRPIAVQIVLDSCSEGSGLSALPMALKRVFPMALRSPSSRPHEQADFSEIHLARSVLVLQRIFRREEQQRNPMGQLQALNDIFVNWLQQFQYRRRCSSSSPSLPASTVSAPAASLGMIGNNGNCESFFYDYNSILDQEAILKFVHLYCTVLSVKNAFCQVQSLSEASQKERANRLVHFQQIFMEALSTTSSAMPKIKLEPGGPWLSLRTEVLHTFSWLFSFASTDEPSPSYLNINLCYSVLQGLHEPVTSIKTLESRLIITITLVGWFVSTQSDDYTCLTRELLALVQFYKERPRCLYYQPNQMGPERSYEEEPTTLLQNYVILVMILTKKECINFILELDMLQPLAVLLAESSHQGGEGACRLLLDLCDAALFRVVLFDMCSYLLANAEHLEEEHLMKLLSREHSFLRIVTACRKILQEPPSNLPSDLESSLARHRVNLSKIETKVAKMISRDVAK